MARAVAHGISRGAIAKARGQTFRSGFWSGFASSAFSPGSSMGGKGAGGFTLRTSIASVVGGTASKLGGGKFSNGAVSGAFVHMFNAEGLKTLKKFIEGISHPASEVAISSGAQKSLKMTTINPRGANIMGDMVGGALAGAAGGFVALGPVGAFIGGVFGTGAGFITGSALEYSGFNATQESATNSVLNHDYVDSFEDIMHGLTRY